MTFIRKIKKKSGTYLAEVKSYRENGKIKQKVIKYLGKEIGDRCVRKICTNDIAIKNVKQSLDITVINAIAKQLQLDEIQNKHILSLVYSHLLEERSINKIEEWLRFTEIPEILSIEPSTSKFYEALSDFEEFDKIESNLDLIFRKYDDDKDIAIIDVTDTYFEGKTENSKKRKGKDGKVRRLIQIGLAVTLNNGFPLFHKKYHGNLSNIQIYKDMILKLKERKLSSVIVDRGMMSPENLKATLQLEVEVITGLIKSPTLIKDFISKIKRDEIYTLKKRIELKSTAVFVQSFDYMDGTLIVVYNPSLEVIKKEINFAKGNENKGHIGFSLIYHNTSLSESEVVKKYYEKEIVERAFKQLKGILKLRPIRLFLKEHVEGHVKICYLAYAILSFMNYKLKKLNISAINALDSLKHGYKVTLKDKTNKFDWSLTVPLEPHQKKILKALSGVTP